jgi:hypothetical protein
MLKYLVIAVVGYYVYVHFFLPKIQSGRENEGVSSRAGDHLSDEDYVDYEEIK